MNNKSHEHSSVPRFPSELSNKQISTLGATSTRKEILIGAEKLAILDTWDLFVRDNCNDLGTIEGSKTLTKQEELGRREIQTGIVERNWCLYSTDKSSRSA